MARRGPKGIDRDKVLPLILAEVASGIALDNVLKRDGFPSSSTFWRWHMEDEQIRENLAIARTHAAEVHVGEMISIADDVKADPDPASRKVRIYAREKFAQMVAPRKYGAKLDLTSDGKALGLSDAMRAAEKRMSDDES